MGIKTYIVGGERSTPVMVTGRGQVVTAPLEYSRFYIGVTTSDDVAINIVRPRTRKKFVITDIILSADRSVGVNGAVVDVFEALDPSSETITRSIYQDEIAKQTRATLTGLNVLIINEGRWINVKADDTAIRAAIGGYYVDAGGFVDNSGDILSAT